MMHQPSFEVYKAADGWRWRLRAKNRKIVADSGEAYASKRNCYRAACHMINLIYEARVEVV